MPRLPKKLKNDAIVEAVLEFRFDSKDIPEVLLGRLADHEPWSKFEQRRLPIADMPTALRLADETLRYQPLFELREETETRKRSAKIGTHVFSFHVLAPYCGWQEFSPQLHDLTEFLFSKIIGIQVRRLGLRYINALTPERHGVHNASDLHMQVTVSSVPLTDAFNLNFSRTIDSETEVLVRIATPKFVQGNLPPTTSAYVDVDVFTPAGFRSDTKDRVDTWIDKAHETEKKAFFEVLGPELTEKNRAE